MPFLKLIRFPNLLIVVLTQYFLQYFILLPAFRAVGLSPLLDHFHFALLVFSTVLIAAGGYLINDLEDYEIDLLNKPKRVIINKNISAANARKLYWGISIFGFLLSLYLAFHVNNMPLVLIYPTAIFLLYLYSTHLKKSVLWGNIIVSIFCAFVAGLVIFAERTQVAQLKIEDVNLGSELVNLFLFYLLFAFFSTMFREIIKDVEDLEGDAQIGCRTLPIVHGVKVAKWVASFFAIVLLLILGYWIFLKKNAGWNAGTVYIIFGIIAPLVFALVKLISASSKKDFHFLSQLGKYIMLSGILYLILIGLS